MKVSVIMGSASDKPVGDKVIKVLEEFGVENELRVISAHRTPYVAKEFAENAEEKGTEVIVAIAGKAAHLAGVLAGISPLPVIGVPAKSSTMDGLDSLLSVVQMPKGVPVATVAIDGGENAGLLAVQILSVKYPELREKFKAYKVRMAEETIKSDEELNQK
ncbi:5-(carboxyamino)imidazole ribonucleotide mutase [Gudongella oleilytica]|jgi:5-(carboxyamino)imidazole ribonucleotide mutase|uniref:5-(carboxyamino)imidazole ribonucleotide mutase n=1 Tax=Gudongella oleilytica TaxID=1582259 RepID=UPI000EBA4754|nr:5-(carboxyamino)imidazole ribonucleotide mutase [Gudongella oleilytica]HCO19050.1 5-(carboxyamino)imidazole ribonucleotide mutase [Tissierellales bacterium]HMM69112.1 5-(carboxyamino)imidazole ribonucleotide mutase [Gudongella oleilytica]